ncbi:MAG TPA: HAD-IA family hydrolase, partial [Pirellulaceae bacterium]|nr:HAD-IA family hydrolase [Pirellulaceae bacterium]
AVVLGQRDDTPRKPDPTGALAIARQLGVAPANCLYVGDTNTDMETACAAGMYPVGVSWGFRTVEELRAHGAAQIIDRPEELLALLN